MDSATLRQHVEAALERRVASPFTYRRERGAEATPSGVAELDRALGGVPRGALTEICGPESSGRTTLLISMLAQVASAGEVCALVDGTDAFDPYSLREAGVDPRRLLWVRCRNLEQVLRCTDLLLQSGGFGMMAVDLAGYPVELVRRIPLSTWFRFRRAVENTRTVFVALEQQPTARTCASVVLGLEADRLRWSSKPRVPELTHTRLLCGARLRVEISRTRLAAAPSVGARFDAQAQWFARPAGG